MRRIREFDGVTMGMPMADVKDMPQFRFFRAVISPEVTDKDRRGDVVRWRFPTCTLTFKNRYGRGGVLPLCMRVTRIEVR